MDMGRLVGRNLKRWRVERGLTQAELAERAGITTQYLGEMERGKRNPTIVLLYLLAVQLDISHVELVLPDEEAKAEDVRGKTSSAKK